jgi:CRP-like cAMP-binding protein
MELFRQGEEHRGIFLIKTGLVRTYYTSPAGREITLAYWRPGNFVGGPDVFSGRVHMWSCVAVDETEATLFRGHDLRDLMIKFPELAVGIVEALAFKGRCFSSLVQILGTRSISERLAQVLLALCDLYGVRQNGGIAISARFTHEDLAHMIGASRQWVTITINRLEQKRIVQIRKRQVIVLRPDLLGPADKNLSRPARMSTN